MVRKFYSTHRYTTTRVDRDEMINHIISECNKFSQREYKTRHDRVDKEIHREVCKKFKFDHTNKK